MFRQEPTGTSWWEGPPIRATLRLLRGPSPGGEVAGVTLVPHCVLESERFLRRGVIPMVQVGSQARL